MGVRGLAKYLNNLGAYKKLILSNQLKQDDKRVLIIDGDGYSFLNFNFLISCRLVYYLWLQQLSVDSLHGGSFPQYIMRLFNLEYF
jgi:hypothetical protein